MLDKTYRVEQSCAFQHGVESAIYDFGRMSGLMRNVEVTEAEQEEINDIQG